MEASLEQKIFALLKKRNETVTFAESLTGGLVSARFVDVAGVSAVYKEGYISYSDDAKKKFFHVSEEVLHVHTAVSEPCARQMPAEPRINRNTSAERFMGGYRMASRRGSMRFA